MKGEYLLRGHLFALEEVDSPSTMVARFSIQLELLQIKTNMVLWTQSYSHDQPVPDKKIDAVVEAMRQDVVAGIEQLTVGLGQYFSNHPQK
jgi:ABC-type uncharacterized transport system auxiliary subunit